jgi:hypothetical protein
MAQDSDWVHLCTREELASAYGLLFEPEDVDGLVEYFFSIHLPDKEGRALWLPPHAQSIRMRTGGGGLVTGPMRSGNDNLKWARYLRSLPPRGRQDILLLVEGPTLDLLSLVSDDLARRVQLAMKFSDGESARLRDEARRAVELAKCE